MKHYSWKGGVKFNIHGGRDHGHHEGRRARTEIGRWTDLRQPLPHRFRSQNRTVSIAILVMCIDEWQVYLCSCQNILSLVQRQERVVGCAVNCKLEQSRSRMCTVSLFIVHMYPSLSCSFKLAC